MRDCRHGRSRLVICAGVAALSPLSWRRWRAMRVPSVMAPMSPARASASLAAMAAASWRSWRFAAARTSSVASGWVSSRGDYDYTTPDVQDLTGQPPRSFEDFAAAHRDAWQPPD